MNRSNVAKNATLSIHQWKKVNGYLTVWLPNQVEFVRGWRIPNPMAENMGENSSPIK
jgi:hypothetical protein